MQRGAGFIKPTVPCINKTHSILSPLLYSVVIVKVSGNSSDFKLLCYFIILKDEINSYKYFMCINKIHIYIYIFFDRVVTIANIVEQAGYKVAVGI